MGSGLTGGGGTTGGGVATGGGTALTSGGRVGVGFEVGLTSGMAEVPSNFQSTPVILSHRILR